MSREKEALRQLARAELGVAWTHARRLPACTGDAVSAFARKHPILAAGGAAALAMSIATRMHRRSGADGKPSSWTMAIAAIGTRMLPDVLRLVGLTTVERAEAPEDEGIPSEASRH